MLKLSFIFVGMLLTLGWYVFDLKEDNERFLKANAELVSANTETNETVRKLLEKQELIDKIDSENFAKEQRQSELLESLKSKLKDKENEANKYKENWFSTRMPDSAQCLLDKSNLPRGAEVCADSTAGKVDETNTKASSEETSNTDGLIYSLDLEDALTDCNRDKASLAAFFAKQGGHNGYVD